MTDTSLKSWESLNLEGGVRESVRRSGGARRHHRRDGRDKTRGVPGLYSPGDLPRLPPPLGSGPLSKTGPPQGRGPGGVVAGTGPGSDRLLWLRLSLPSSPLLRLPVLRSPRRVASSVSRRSPLPFLSRDDLW